MLPYLSLTKPRISLLFALTGLAALLMEGSLASNPLRLWLIVAAIFLVGGSANAFNQYFERDVDSLMERTAKKRPLPLNQISPLSALLFSVVIGLVGTGLLWVYGGLWAFVFGLGTIVFYSFYYTLWLKPRTPYNIVIGGIAGATGPLIGWAAATGHLHWAPILMFLVVFFWTPPHFWALALCCKEDYAKVNYPMFPLVKGDEATRRQILAYSFGLLPLTLALYAVAPLGMFYLAGSSLLSLLFIFGAWRVYRGRNKKISYRFFGYSIVYLLLLFVLIITDTLV